MAEHTALKRAVFDSGRSQRVIAAQASIHETRLSKLVNGWAEATADERKKLAQVLQKSIAQLFPEVAA